MTQIRTKQFPQWLKKRLPVSAKRSLVEQCLSSTQLHTVCQEAKCPNKCECFEKGTATFLLMGPICSRACLFCSVTHGKPLPLDQEEPQKITQAIEKLNLKYAVITTVTRDDLPDGGAFHIAKTVCTIKENNPQILIEVLVPDFKGSQQSLDCIIKSKPDIFNHNIETVPSLYSTIRPQALYSQSLDVLNYIAKNSSIPTKSGFMVGLGESENEVLSLIQDLKKFSVSILTIGQYLQPTSNHIPVKEFITPEQFEFYKEKAIEQGIPYVYSGPFIRSSYMAAEAWNSISK